jgi:hypothetical protein
MYKKTQAKSLVSNLAIRWDICSIQHVISCKRPTWTVKYNFKMKNYQPKPTGHKRENTPLCEKRLQNTWSKKRFIRLPPLWWTPSWWFCYICACQQTKGQYIDPNIQNRSQIWWGGSNRGSDQLQQGKWVAKHLHRLEASHKMLHSYRSSLSMKYHSQTSTFQTSAREDEANVPRNCV